MHAANSAGHITVPGTAAGWVDSVARFGSGKMSMQDILAAAITLAEEGFPVRCVRKGVGAFVPPERQREREREPALAHAKTPPRHDQADDVNYTPKPLHHPLLPAP